MTDNDFDKFGVMICTLGEMYAKTVTSNMIGLYFHALKTYDIADIGRGFNLHVRNPDNGQFFPKPADVVRMIDGDSGTQGGLAWTKVLSAIKSIGGYRSVVFDDQVIHRVITDMGGWPKLCECKEAETPFVAKEFERRYQGYSTRRAGLDKNYAPVLTGITDAQNAGGGFKTEAPLLIGDSQVALATMRLGSGTGKPTSISLEDLLNGNPHVRGRIQENTGAQRDCGGALHSQRDCHYSGETADDPF